MLPLLGSRGPIPWFLVLTLVGVSAFWRRFVDVGHPTPIVINAPQASVGMPASPHY